jgi:NDP-sugar pyrophosphorylase family protein
MPDVFDGIMSAGHAVGSFPIHEYWMDVGRIADYEEANEAYDTHFAG